MGNAEVFAAQGRYRWTAKNRSAADRIADLLRLKQVCLSHAAELALALHLDLGRPAGDNPPGELNVALGAIDDTVAHLEAWMRPETVLEGPVRGEIRYEARGRVLLFSAWNFPFQLTLEPLAAIIGAGNTCVVKPNEQAPETSRVIASILKAAFREDHVAVIEGGVDTANELLALPFDHIFFTGSPAVGRVVMAAAAKHLASVTLELGGKNPVVLDKTCDLETAAREIAGGRQFNGGQLCLSPDFAFVPEGSMERFLDAYRTAVQEQFYENGRLKAGWGRPVNEANRQRVMGYLTDAVDHGAQIVFGGKISTDQPGYIEPTAVIGVDLDSPLMTNEIFGPVLPVVPYDAVEEILAYLESNPKPLCLYAYTKDAAFADTLLSRSGSGGVTVNGVAIHWGVPGLPFGGVGNSGMGAYHGLHGFRALSHARAVALAGLPH